MNRLFKFSKPGGKKGLPQPEPTPDPEAPVYQLEPTLEPEPTPDPEAPVYQYEPTPKKAPKFKHR